MDTAMQDAGLQKTVYNDAFISNICAMYRPRNMHSIRYLHVDKTPQVTSSATPVKIASLREPKIVPKSLKRASSAKAFRPSDSGALSLPLEDTISQSRLLTSPLSPSRVQTASHFTASTPTPLAYTVHAFSPPTSPGFDGQWNFSPPPTSHIVVRYDIPSRSGSPVAGLSSLKDALVIPERDVVLAQHSQADHLSLIGVQKPHSQGTSDAQSLTGDLLRRQTRAQRELHDLHAQRVVPLPHKPTGGKFVGHQYGGQLLSFPAEILLEEEPARAAHSAFERTVKSLDPTAAPVLDADHIPDRTTVLTATGVQKVDPAVINALANMMFPSTSTASSAAAPSPALKLPIQVKLSAKQKLLVDQLHRYLASSAQSNSESSAELISLVGHPIIIRGASDLQSAADTVARALQERAEAEQRAAVAAHAAVLAHRVWTSTNSKPPSLALTSTGAPHTGVSDTPGRAVGAAINVGTLRRGFTSEPSVPEITVPQQSLGIDTKKAAAVSPRRLAAQQAKRQAKEVARSIKLGGHAVEMEHRVIRPISPDRLSPTKLRKLAAEKEAQTPSVPELPPRDLDQQFSSVTNIPRSQDVLAVNLVAHVNTSAEPTAEMVDSGSLPESQPAAVEHHTDGSASQVVIETSLEVVDECVADGDNSILELDIPPHGSPITSPSASPLSQRPQSALIMMPATPASSEEQIFAAEPVDQQSVEPIVESDGTGSGPTEFVNPSVESETTPAVQPTEPAAAETTPVAIEASRPGTSKEVRVRTTHSATLLRSATQRAGAPSRLRDNRAVIDPAAAVAGVYLQVQPEVAVDVEKKLTAVAKKQQELPHDLSLAMRNAEAASIAYAGQSMHEHHAPVTVKYPPSKAEVLRSTQVRALPAPALPATAAELAATISMSAARESVVPFAAVQLQSTFNLSALLDSTSSAPIVHTQTVRPQSATVTARRALPVPHRSIALQSLLLLRKQLMMSSELQIVIRAMWHRLLGLPLFEATPAPQKIMHAVPPPSPPPVTEPVEPSDAAPDAAPSSEQPTETSVADAPIVQPEQPTAAEPQLQLVAKHETIARRIYQTFNVLLYHALLPLEFDSKRPMPIAPAQLRHRYHLLRRAIAADWKVDSENGTHMNQGQFFLSMFELAEAWCVQTPPPSTQPSQPVVPTEVAMPAVDLSNIDAGAVPQSDASHAPTPGVSVSKPSFTNSEQLQFVSQQARAYASFLEQLFIRIDPFLVDALRLNQAEPLPETLLTQSEKFERMQEQQDLAALESFDQYSAIHRTASAGSDRQSALSDPLFPTFHSIVSAYRGPQPDQPTTPRASQQEVIDVEGSPVWVPVTPAHPLQSPDHHVMQYRTPTFERRISLSVAQNTPSTVPVIAAPEVKTSAPAEAVLPAVVAATAQLSAAAPIEYRPLNSFSALRARLTGSGGDAKDNHSSSNVFVPNYTSDSTAKLVTVRQLTKSASTTSVDITSGPSHYEVNKTRSMRDKNAFVAHQMRPTKRTISQNTPSVPATVSRPDTTLTEPNTDSVIVSDKSAEFLMAGRETTAAGHGVTISALASTSNLRPRSASQQNLSATTVLREANTVASMSRSSSTIMPDLSASIRPPTMSSPESRPATNYSAVLLQPGKPLDADSVLRVAVRSASFVDPDDKIKTETLAEQRARLQAERMKVHLQAEEQSRAERQLAVAARGLLDKGRLPAWTPTAHHGVDPVVSEAAIASLQRPPSAKHTPAKPIVVPVTGNTTSSVSEPLPVVATSTDISRPSTASDGSRPMTGAQTPTDVPTMVVELGHGAKMMVLGTPKTVNVTKPPEVDTPSRVSTGVSKERLRRAATKQVVEEIVADEYIFSTDDVLEVPANDEEDVPNLSAPALHDVATKEERRKSVLRALFPSLPTPMASPHLTYSASTQSLRTPSRATPKPHGTPQYFTFAAGSSPMARTAVKEEEPISNRVASLLQKSKGISSPAVSDAMPRNTKLTKGPLPFTAAARK